MLNPLTRRTKGKSKKGAQGGSANDDGKSVSDELVQAASAVINQAGKGKGKVEKAVHVSTPVLLLMLCTLTPELCRTWGTLS